MTRHRTRRGGCIGWMLWLIPLAAAGGCEEPRVELAHGLVLEHVKTVAVVPLADAPGGKAKGSGETVVGAIMEVLYKVPGIRVVERKHLDKIIDEEDLRLANLSENTAAARLGKLAGADAVLVGEVRQWEAQVDGSSLAVSYLATSKTEHTHRVGMGVRAVNVTPRGDYRCGDVVFADSGDGVCKEGISRAARYAAQEALRDLVLYFKQRHRLAQKWLAAPK